MKEKKMASSSAKLLACDAERSTPREQDHYTAIKRDCQINRRTTRMDEEQRPGYWAIIPAAVRYDTKVPPMARLLYAEISSLTDQRGYCYASNAYFMRLFGFAERTLQRHLRVLEERGYIWVEDGAGGAGRRKIYGGINPLANNPDKIDGVTPTKMSPNPDKNVAHIKKDNRKENNTPQSPPGGSEGSDIWDPEAFERFWQLYPKKRDKAKCIQAWNKLKADRKLMRVMSAALGRQMASEEWQRDNGRAIPYPCRWLSHRRWEDELTVTMPEPVPRTEEAPEWI